MGRERIHRTALRRYTKCAQEQREKEAENRRKLLKSLSPGAAKLAKREFAKLGLTQ